MNPLIFFLLVWSVSHVILFVLDRCHLIPYPGFQKKGHRHHKPRLLIHAKSISITLFILIPLSFILMPLLGRGSSMEPTRGSSGLGMALRYNFSLPLPGRTIALFPFLKPQRGDEIIVRCPIAPHQFYGKRLIGLPGDIISYHHKQLIINGEPMALKKLEKKTIPIEGKPISGVIYQENLKGKIHRIFINPNIVSKGFTDLHVPKGMYFVMGDNRDYSSDSRAFGFVPKKNLIGTPLFTINLSR